MAIEIPAHLSHEQGIILQDVDDMITRIKAGTEPATPHELRCLERYRDSLSGRDTEA